MQLSIVADTIKFVHTGKKGRRFAFLKTPKMSRWPKRRFVHCNFVMDKSIHTRMKYLAIGKGMSLKGIVNEAMREYLERNGK